MEIEKLEALERLATAGERIAAALEAIASANGCRIEAAKDAAAEAVADVVPEATPVLEPCYSVAATTGGVKAEQAEKPAAPAKPEAPAADQLDPEALRLDIIKRVKAFCLADMANNKPKVGALFARFGLNRVSAIEAADAFEIDAALKDELGI